MNVDVEDYYSGDIGRVPAAVQYATRYAPEAFAGYMRSRASVISETEDSALPKRYANLIFSVLDVATGNVEGATNHARASLASGLRQEELVAAYVQSWLVAGFAAAWGKVCWHVLEQLETEGVIQPR